LKLFSIDYFEKSTGHGVRHGSKIYRTLTKFTGDRRRAGVFRQLWHVPNIKTKNIVKNPEF
jgi:hypothetical protein